MLKKFVGKNKSSLYYDKDINRYRSRKNGQTVSLSKVLKDLADYRASVKVKSSSSFDQIKAKLTELSVTHYVVGRGGLLVSNKKELRRLSDSIDDQISLTGDYSLQLLFRRYKNNEITEAMFFYRLGQFFKSAKTQFWHGTLEAQQGKTEYKRVLGATDRSCPECLAMARAGWTPIANGVVLPTQQCSCINNCRCSLVFR